MIPKATLADFTPRMAMYSASNPEIRSALRSGLGKPVDRCDHMHGHLAHWLNAERGGTRIDDHDQRCLYTIASLIAHTPEGAIPDVRPGNLGATLAVATRRGILAAATTARSVERLGKQPSETVCRSLVHIVVPLRSNRIPVDFTVLLEDLLAWPHSQHRVRKNWLQSYHIGLDKEDEPSPPDSNQD
ncbi:type I-E CRISPR-associated protein Cse2/CasB [Saccharothrix sp. Mg75]|uniref:type I-E CRISPR-associated protein Cse2/CasB n=1 Tax=Saccharothrix sp. Mg75 TaxID=3445357 RepID=UPI003EE94B88